MTAYAKWGSWTTYYDSAGQVPSMSRSIADDGLSVQFNMDRLLVSLQGDSDAPFAGTVGLSGELSVNVQEEFDLMGFLLVVRGDIEKTDGSQGLVTCSIGHGTQSFEWPLVSVAGTLSPGPSDTTEERRGEASVLSSDFRVECFTSDFNPAILGVPPYPPMPPFPITISLQARRRLADEAVEIGVTDFSVILVRSS
jgi:hypothetical protein